MRTSDMRGLTDFRARPIILGLDENEEILAWVRRRLPDGATGDENLIGVLQALQRRFGYLPKAGLLEVARRKRIAPATAYGVATFYNQFRFTPPGRRQVKVCTGTACHIKQSALVLDHWERRLSIHAGEVTPDREYGLDRVGCVGCCVMAPVTVVDDEVIGGMAPSKVDGILLRHRIERDRAEAAKRPDTSEGDA